METYSQVDVEFYNKCSDDERFIIDKIIDLNIFEKAYNIKSLHFKIKNTSYFFFPSSSRKYFHWFNDKDLIDLEEVIRNITDANVLEVLIYNMDFLMNPLEK